MKRVDVVVAGERKHRGSGAPLYNTRTAVPPKKGHTTMGVYLTSVHLMGGCLTPHGHASHRCTSHEDTLYAYVS
jgi:hypothetical protein